MFSFTIGEVATSTCLVSAPTTSDRPFISMPEMSFDLRHVDDVLRPGEAKLHGRDQRVAAGEELCFFLAGQKPRRLPHRGRAMEFEFVHGVPSLISENARCCARYALAMALAPAAIAFTMLW